MKGISLKQAGVLLLLTLGLILAFSPVKNTAVNKIDPAMLASEILDLNDHITAEQLGRLIIDEDPDYQLVDLRDPEEFEKFHIKTAVNIPLKELFSPQNLDLLDPEKLIVLYTDGGTHAAQAWVLLKTAGITNSLVLLGGLNFWVDVYSNPKPPEGVHADSEIATYQFQVSAGSYLMGNVQTETKQTEEIEPIKIQIPKKKKGKKADEGC